MLGAGELSTGTVKGAVIGGGGAMGAVEVGLGVAFSVTRTVSLRRGTADVFFIGSLLLLSLISND